MPRKASTQWEFGELFPDKDLRRVLTVSELNTSIRRILEERIGTVWVGGEVTNLRVQASGHAYFSLKDESSQLNCVLFRGTPVAGRQLLDNGMKLLIEAELTVYEPRGQYQLIVQTMELQGVGRLQVAFEKLKRELAAAGYFDPGRKRIIPAFPQKIGLVTSPTGAAIRDVLHAIRRRHPGLEIVLSPCRVQGDGAGEEIAEAIATLNLWSASRHLPGSGALDLILITRGGGSLEDLWAFNERVVADAILKSYLPVVSAVGHEIDFTISDLVADLRAATPTAGAELITEKAVASRTVIRDAVATIHRRSRQHLLGLMGQLRELSHRLGRGSPLRLVRDRMQAVDDVRSRVLRRINLRLRELEVSAQAAVVRHRRTHPLQRLLRHQKAVDAAIKRGTRAFNSRLRSLNTATVAALDRLRLLSPANTLARGYSITTEERGSIVRQADQLKAGDRVSTQVAKGIFVSQVIQTDRS
ncbi:MAG TPA: exodeoxyribonuclease VII large subunit [Verrucomicrobiales bacterium]|nr:exodeoxyribonuclease VII large subunit [Verrucomicrobiales bacterium]